VSGPSHAAPKTPKERSQTVQERPPTDVPAERPVEQTQVLPRVVVDSQEPIVDGRNGLTGLLPEHTTDVIRTNVEDLQADQHKTRDWATGSFPVRGVAVGVPAPDQVFLNPAAADFTKWAEDWLSDTAPQVQAKAEQYGSNSLAAMGHLAARMQGRKVSEIEALEVGCAVYAFGKMERVMDAVLRGGMPGRDTWHDLAVYSLMVLFMREHGRWP
jgi:hypothetical protein